MRRRLKTCYSTQEIADPASLDYINCSLSSVECNNYSNSIPNGLDPANESVTQRSVIYTSCNNPTNRDFAINHRTLLCTLCFGSSETEGGEEWFCACSNPNSFQRRESCTSKTYHHMYDSWFMILISKPNIPPPIHTYTACFGFCLRFALVVLVLTVVLHFVTVTIHRAYQMFIVLVDDFITEVVLYSFVP